MATARQAIRIVSLWFRWYFELARWHMSHQSIKHVALGTARSLLSWQSRGLPSLANASSECDFLTWESLNRVEFLSEGNETHSWTAVKRLEELVCGITHSMVQFRLGWSQDSSDWFQRLLRRDGKCMDVMLDGHVYHTSSSLQAATSDRWGRNLIPLLWRSQSQLSRVVCMADFSTWPHHRGRSAQLVGGSTVTLSVEVSPSCAMGIEDLGDDTGKCSKTTNFNYHAGSLRSKTEMDGTPIAAWSSFCHGCVSRSCAGSYLLIAARAACLAELQRTECIGRRNRLNNILSLSLHGCYLDALVVTQEIHFLPHTQHLWPQTLDIAMHRTTIVQDLLQYIYIYIFIGT